MKWDFKALRELYLLKPREFAKKYKIEVDEVYKVKYKNKDRMERLHNEENREEVRKLVEEFREHGVDIPDHLIDDITKFNVWQSASKDADGEPQITTLRGVEVKPRYDREEDEYYYPPAVAANITPTRRKGVKRDHRVLFVFSDAQIGFRRVGEELVPMHDERAMRVARLICRDIAPDKIINLGDTVDLPELSRFPKDSDHFYRTLGPAFQAAHDFYAQLRADHPNAEIIEVDSNHNTRLQKFALKNAPDLYGMRQAGSESQWPVLTYPFLANLDAVGVEWVSGYGAAEYIHNDDLVFVHGTNAVSNGSTANKNSKQQQEVNYVQGHVHRSEMHTRTNRMGEYLVSLVVPALCKTDGIVPGYHSAVDDTGKPVKRQQNWQNGVSIIHDYGDGNYNFQNVLINEGKAFYNGKEYEA